MTRKLIKDDRTSGGEFESESFLNRMRSAQIFQGDLDFARQQYGEELPDDVIEQVARQQATARPVLEQYHMLHEMTPPLALARATGMQEIDAITDFMAALDLNDLGDVGDMDDEYSCPRCAHRWSGAPNYLTGYANKVYVPTGRISRRSGRVVMDRYGGASQPKANFKYGRAWKGASAEKLPRGFGNKPIGTPIVGDNWRKRGKRVSDA